MLALGKTLTRTHAEETFYVAVFVKPFLSSSSSAMILCPLQHLRL
jgi:hypothetical protein